MWELSISPLRQVPTLRKLLAGLVTILVTAFLWLTLFPTPTFAADAFRSSNDIVYENHTYTGPAIEEMVGDLKLAPKTPVYSYLEPSGTTRKLHVIYFLPNENPLTTGDAAYRTYEYKGGRTFENPSSPIAIKVIEAPSATWQGADLVFNGDTYTGPAIEEMVGDLKLAPKTPVYSYLDKNTLHVLYFTPGENPLTATKAAYKTYTHKGGRVYESTSDPIAISVSARSASSCQIDGIGWIVCPITTYIAKGMDTVYDWVTGFLEVKPAQTTNTDNALYVAWNIMRSVANVAFVIAFLVMIYSQITNAGISNYGIKKLLPRMIIAAILVNISYHVCALMIDLSNTLGYSFQSLLVNLRETLFDRQDVKWTIDMFSWESVAGFILSGGTIVAGGLVGFFASGAGGGSVAALAFILIPTVLGLFLSILVVFLILAARQAIITLLVVIAPIALVAYLLPNTEKWFEKWRELFMTMLIFFPAFSLIFGGSQLAAAIIIQNAQSINEVLLALAVQVAPLVITPILLKLSGALLSRIAGLINNPNRGLIDSTKNWANERAEHHRKRIRAGRSPLNGLNLSRRLYDGKKKREFKNSMYDQEAEQRFEEAKSRKRGLYKTEVALQISKIHTENAKKDLQRAVEELKAGNDTGAQNQLLVGSANIARSALAADTRSRVLNNAIHSAEHEQTLSYARTMEASEALRKVAGGIDPHGASQALATATQTIFKAFDDAKDAEQTTMTSTGSPGLKAILRDTSLSDERRAAAVSQIIKVGGDADLHEVLDYLGTAPRSESISTLQKQFGADIGSRKPISIGQADVANMRKGDYAGTWDSKVKSRLTSNGGKVSLDNLRTGSADELKEILRHKDLVSPALKAEILKFRADPRFLNQQPAQEIADLMDKIAAP